MQVLFYHHVHGPLRIKLCDEAITPMQTVGSGPAQIQPGPDGRTDGSDSHAYAYAESLE